MSQVNQDINNEDIKVFLDSIKARSNYDFTDYSLKSIKRRFTKILSDTKLSVKELENEILNNPEFMEEVVKNITVNTTELFRDPATWVFLKDEILPKFYSLEKINIWHAGCSSGQEIYSMMMILDEAGLLSKSDIYGSDINSGILDVAKKGRYKYRYNHAYIENFDKVFNEGKNKDGKNDKVSYTKYFTVNKVSDYIQMKLFLIEKPVYKKIDLVKNENLFRIKFDLIICRNVIIYFNSELQNKVLNLFYENLHKNGCLVLGIHESIIGPFSSRFEKRKHAYFKKEK